MKIIFKTPIISRFSTLVLLFFISSLVFSQGKPVEISTTLIPPYSVFLSDYLSQGSNKLQVNIIFKDYNEVSWDVRLKITIQSNTILLKTKDNFRPLDPITLYPGVSQLIKDEDFSEYLMCQNLDISGITEAELGTNGKLPEGHYTICIEVFDYYSDKSLSISGCVSAYLQLGSTPLAIHPLDKEVVSPNIDQNVLFQWQPAVVMNSGSPVSIQYSISVYELLDNSVNPKMALINQQVEKIFESDYSSNILFQYDASHPPLERGKIYIYQIHVIDNKGFGLFKNNGYSEPYWFYYGYPEGGHIPIISPVNNYSFGKKQQGLFYWNGADNLVQGEEMYYKLKIVLTQGLDSEIAMETEPVWFERTTNMDLIHSDMSLSITKPFIPLENYAWQITAHTIDQVIASSDIYEFRGPPEVEYFIAGNKLIQVTQITNGDLDHFSGVGKLQFTNGGLTQEIHFNDLQLVKSSGSYVMEEGEIKEKITCVDKIEIEAIDSTNNSGFFIPDSLWLSRYDFRINGVFEYNFPHPINSTELGKVTSKKKWLNYNELKIYGNVQVNNLNFDMLSPYNFQFKVWETSQISLIGNKFKFYLKGEIILPPSVTNDTNSVSIFYDNIDNLTYFENSELLISDGLDLLTYTGLQLRPKRVIIDLDASLSPGQFITDPTWKGVYYEDFFLESKTSLDYQGQISLDNFMQKEYSLEQNPSFKAWVTANGTSFYFEKSLENESAKFNQFPSLLTDFLIDIDNNTFNRGHLKGKMKIPVISQTNDYFFTVPLTSTGFHDGYLDVDLENQSFVFNPDGGNQLMNFTIKRAVFAAKERLDLTVDIEWPSIGATMTNVDNLKLWGNYNIGFVVPNGMMNLSEQSVGALSDFQLTINVIGCGRSDGFYSFGTVANVVMSDDVSGPDGAPQINLYSISENILLPEEASYEGSKMSTDYGANEDFFQSQLDSISSQIEELKNLNADLLSLIDSDDTIFENDSTDEYNVYDLSEIITYTDSVQVYSSEEFNGELNNVFDNIQNFISPEYVDLYNGIRSFSINCNVSQKEVIIKKIEEFVKLYAKSLIDSLAAYAMDLITEKTDALSDIVIAKTDSIKGGVNSFVSTKVEALFDGFETKFLDLLENDKFDASSIVKQVILSAKKSLINEINMSVNVSIDNNITIPFTTYIDVHIGNNINRHIIKEVTENVFNYVDTGAEGVDIDIPEIFNDVGEEMLSNIHLEKAGETALALVEDAVNSIDMNNVYNNMKTELMGDVANAVDLLTNIAEEQANDIADQMLGETGMGALAQNISIDFTDIGSKVQEGDLSGIVKIDPTNISVQTAIVDFAGTITYTQGDPIYGDIWLGDIDFSVKIPDPDKPFTIRGIYMNGKVDGYSYWFCQIEPGGNGSGVGGAVTTEAKELSSPLTLGPIKLMAASGRLYNHMHAEGEHGELIVPDQNISYGASLSLILFDAAKSGKTVRIASKAGLEVDISGDYIVDFKGNLQLNGKKPQVNEIDETAMIKGEVAFNYNSKEKHFVGSADVVSEGPQLCLEATLEMDIKPSVWRIAIGSEEQRIIVVPGCAGYSPTGWLIITQDIVDLGLGLSYSAMAASPWYGINKYKVSFFAGFDVAAGVSAIIAYNPKIKIMEAGLWTEAWAGVGADYTSKITSGTWTLAEVCLHGYAKMTFDPPPTKVSGGLSGSVKILCIKKSFSMDFEKTL